MKHASFQHQALIYEGADDYLAATVPFLRSALEAEEPVMVAVGSEQTKLLQGELGDDAEAVRFADMRALGRNPAWSIPLWGDFLAAHEGPVRAIGEAVWAARNPAALEECQRLEALLNLAFRGGPAWSLLCPYDARALPEQVLAEVATSHSHVIANGQRRESPHFEPEPNSLAGELPAPRVKVHSFDFGLSELAEVRSCVASAAERAGLDPRAVADLVTAASELAANSVLHGGGRGVLRIWSEDESLLVEVEDRGRIKEPLVGRLRPGLQQEGGRGLWLAGQLCDLVQIRSGAAGTVVRLHMKVAPGVLGDGDGDGENGGVAVARDG
jgi:anti-sigma regulatory factor (Ser/Thr protein kinase)